jgi:hypothetical protein
MEWKKVEDCLPIEGKMVLIRTREQPIVQYAVASWEPLSDCFVDYDDYSYTATHWCYIKQSNDKLPS